MFRQEMYESCRATQVREVAEARQCNRDMRYDCSSTTVGTEVHAIGDRQINQDCVFVDV